jgi:hypothetical protein
MHDIQIPLGIGNPIGNVRKIRPLFLFWTLPAVGNRYLCNRKLCLNR